MVSPGPVSGREEAILRALSDAAMEGAVQRLMVVGGRSLAGEMVRGELASGTSRMVELIRQEIHASLPKALSESQEVEDVLGKAWAAKSLITDLRMAGIRAADRYLQEVQEVQDAQEDTRDRPEVSP